MATPQAVIKKLEALIEGCETRKGDLEDKLKAQPYMSSAYVELMTLEDGMILGYRDAIDLLK